MAGKFYPCVKKDRVYYMSALQPPGGPCPDPGQKPGGLENMRILLCLKTFRQKEGGCIRIVCDVLKKTK